MRSILLAVALVAFWAAPSWAQGCLDVSQFFDPAQTAGQDETVLAWQRAAIEEEFPYNRDAALEQLREAYPEADAAVLEAFLDDKAAACATIDGEKRYFQNVANNFGYRNVEYLQRKIQQEHGDISPFVDEAHEFVFPAPRAGYPLPDWQSYTAPIEYTLELALRIPRDKLPAAGLLGVWLPLPIETASQRDVRLVTLEPTQYLRARPRTDADIGYAWFEVPLEKLDADLDIHATALFVSYRQRFVVKDGAVQQYDTSRAEYSTYTRSQGNIAITPAIRAEAAQAAKGAATPYQAARTIYRYVLQNIRYSLMPHSTLMLLGAPESAFVQEHRYGDCGAQSMYFAALCRSLGIPARATGGFQLFPRYHGTHFWAEVYIEGYGWLPVDPTVADAADWTGQISEEQRTAFKEYYFGNLDPYRLVVQRDVDQALLPAPKHNFLTPGRPLMVLQFPWIDCPDCSESPLDLVGEYFSWSFEPVTE